MFSWSLRRFINQSGILDRMGAGRTRSFTGRGRGEALLDTPHIVTRDAKAPKQCTGWTKQRKHKRKNYLFICYANVNRSTTAEEVCRRMAEQLAVDLEVTSAGVSGFAANAVTQEMADRADRIFVMEEYMKGDLIRIYSQDPQKIVCFDIPDIYDRGDLRLVRILQDAILPYLKPPFVD